VLAKRSGTTVFVVADKQIVTLIGVLAPQLAAHPAAELSLIRSL